MLCCQPSSNRAALPPQTAEAREAVETACVPVHCSIPLESSRRVTTNPRVSSPRGELGVQVSNNQSCRLQKQIRTGGVCEWHWACTLPNQGQVIGIVRRDRGAGQPELHADNTNDVIRQEFQRRLEVKGHPQGHGSNSILRYVPPASEASWRLLNEPGRLPSRPHQSLQKRPLQPAKLFARTVADHPLHNARGRSATGNIDATRSRVEIFVRL